MLLLYPKAPSVARCVVHRAIRIWSEPLIYITTPIIYGSNNHLLRISRFDQPIHPRSDRLLDMHMLAITWPLKLVYIHLMWDVYLCMHSNSIVVRGSFIPIQFTLPHDYGSRVYSMLYVLENAVLGLLVICARSCVVARCSALVLIIDIYIVLPQLWHPFHVLPVAIGCLL